MMARATIVGVWNFSKKYFIDIHIVLVGAYAKKYHRRCECVCSCLFFALYEECMHTLYVRALPLRCRHTDVNMHAFASRKDLAAVFAPRLNPASQKAVLRAARQQVLNELWPSEQTHSDRKANASENRGATGSVQPLRKWRKLSGWSGDWLQCDECENWVKCTDEELKFYEGRGFVCSMLRLQCKRL